MGGLALVASVVAGELEFSEFVRRTSPDYQRLARYIIRKDSLPAGYELDDVVQVLLDRTWHYIPRWDPKRGQSAEKFVFYNVVSRTRRWLAFARGRCDAMNRTHDLELQFDDGTTGERPAAVLANSVQASQEAELDFERRRRARIESLSRGGQIVAAELERVGYDYRKAARNIYANPDLRYRFQFGSEREACKVAKRMAWAILNS